jgi:hypothetical protein
VGAPRCYLSVFSEPHLSTTIELPAASVRCGVSGLARGCGMDSFDITKLGCARAIGSRT